MLHLRLGKGDGTFAAPTDLPSGGVTLFSPSNSIQYEFLVHGDFNGDGFQDVMVLSGLGNGSAGLYLFLGHGDGSFAGPVPVVVGGSNAPFFSFDQRNVVDINKDGRDDFVFVSTDGKTLTVYLASPGNTLTPVTSNLNSPFGQIAVPAFADVNGDGKLDAIFNVYEGIALAPGNGDGTFASSSSGFNQACSLPVLVAGRTYNRFQPTVTGDFDGDGLLDLATINYWFPSYSGTVEAVQADIYVCYGQGGGTFSSASDVPLFVRNFTRLQAADVDHDGRSDLIFDNAGDLYFDYDPAISIVHGQTGRGFSAETTYIAGSGLSSLTIADLNRDGFPDLVAANGDFNATANSFTVLMNLGIHQPCKDRWWRRPKLPSWGKR